MLQQNYTSYRLTWDALSDELEQWAHECTNEPDLAFCLAQRIVRWFYGCWQVQMLLQNELRTPLRLQCRHPVF